MIEKIQKKIRRILDVRIDFLIEKQQINFDYNYISQLFKEKDLFIPLTEWSLSPKTIAHVLNEIIIHKRKSIIEFGSGASTIYIAKLIKSMNLECMFFSVESNSEWAAEMSRQLKLHRLEEYVVIIQAPLTPVPEHLSCKEQKIWYDADSIQLAIKGAPLFDLVIIDGPAGNSTPFARFSAIPFLEKNLASSFSLFLDDIGRNHELQIIKEWQNILKCEIEYLNRYAVLHQNTRFRVNPFRLSRGIGVS